MPLLHKSRSFWSGSAGEEEEEEEEEEAGASQHQHGSTTCKIRQTEQVTNIRASLRWWCMRGLRGGKTSEEEAAADVVDNGIFVQPCASR